MINKNNIVTIINYSGYWRIGYDNLNGWENAPLSYYFNGNIDEVLIYNRVLTDNEIEAHYLNGIENEVTIILTSGQTIPSPETQVTVTCSNIKDLYSNQAGEQSYTFYPDDGNNNPSIALSNIDNEQSSDIRIDYVISDTEGDVVSLIPEYTTDGGANWHSATVAGSINSIPQSNYTGYLVWNSETDLSGRDVLNVKFKITPRDADPHNFGTPGMTNAFNLDNNHSHSISIALADTQEEYSDSVRISYALTDNTYDLLRISCYYKDSQQKVFSRP